MIDEKVFIGYPINFKGLFKIYPPKVKDVVGNDFFSLYRKVLTLSQEEIEDEFVEKKLDMKDLLTPFEYLLNNAYNIEGFEKIIKQAFSFFIQEEITFLYEQKMIVIGNIEEELKNAKSIQDLRFLREIDYFDFQNSIRYVLGDKTISPPNPNEHPRIKQMKAKARYRDKIKAKQGGGLSLSASLISICCMGLGLNPLNIGELTYAAIHPLIAYYQEKEKYDLDVKSLLAGADSKKIKPKYWIRNIED